jgi:hypothetical protein
MHCHPFYNHDGSVKGYLGNTGPIARAMLFGLRFSLIRKGLVLILLLPFA